MAALRWKPALAVIAIAIAYILPPAANGADQTPLVKLLSDPSMQQHLIGAAGRSTVMLQNPCATARYSLEQKISFYKQPSFDAGGKLLDGAWKHVIDEEGCGVKRQLNVMLFTEGAGDISVTPLLPGTTRADPVLQKDAVNYAVQALATVPGGREPNCRIGYVADTEFIEQESTSLAGAKGPSWRELWTLTSCTQHMQVPIHFIPDATGTSISAGPSTAIKIIPFKDNAR